MFCLPFVPYVISLLVVFCRCLSSFVCISFHFRCWYHHFITGFSLLSMSVAAAIDCRAELHHQIIRKWFEIQCINIYLYLWIELYQMKCTRNTCTYVRIISSTHIHLYTSFAVFHFVRCEMRLIYLIVFNSYHINRKYLLNMNKIWLLIMV